jgi:very-short-patch-repair endonuclease
MLEKHWVRVAAMADAQHGVVAAWQLRDLGMAYSVMAERATRGHLFRIHHGVYAVGRRNLTTKGHWMAAVFACGRHSFRSHRTAAALHGVRQTSQRKVDITTPTWRPDRPTIRIHSATLRPEDTANLDNIPTTSIARTILDLAALLTETQLARVIEEAERRQLFDLRSLHKAMGRRPTARGTKTLRSVLAAYTDPANTRSELERAFLALIRNAKISEPLVNTIVAGLEVDFFWPQFNLVVELDGRAYHTTAKAFERDRERDAILLRHGIRVLRITYNRLTTAPGSVIADLTALTTRKAA